MAKKNKKNDVEIKETKNNTPEFTELEVLVNKNNVGVIQQKAGDSITIVTRDGKPSAHFEHTVAIREGKADILSSFDYIKEVLGDRFI